MKQLPLTLCKSIRVNESSKVDASRDIGGSCLRYYWNLLPFWVIRSRLASITGTTVLHPWEWAYPAITLNEYCGSPWEDSIHEHSRPSESESLPIREGGWEITKDTRCWLIVLFKFTLVSEEHKPCPWGTPFLSSPSTSTSINLDRSKPGLFRAYGCLILCLIFLNFIDWS
jgi:hypothetical protein